MSIQKQNLIITPNQAEKLSKSSSKKSSIEFYSGDQSRISMKSRYLGFIAFSNMEIADSNIHVRQSCRNR